MMTTDSCMNYLWEVLNVQAFDIKFTYLQNLQIFMISTNFVEIWILNAYKNKIMHTLIF